MADGSSGSEEGNYFDPTEAELVRPDPTLQRETAILQRMATREIEDIDPGKEILLRCLVRKNSYPEFTHPQVHTLDNLFSYDPYALDDLHPWPKRSPKNLYFFTYLPTCVTYQSVDGTWMSTGRQISLYENRINGFMRYLYFIRADSTRSYWSIREFRLADVQKQWIICNVRHIRSKFFVLETPKNQQTPEPGSGSKRGAAKDSQQGSTKKLCQGQAKGSQQKDQAECSRQGKGAEYHEAASLADEVSKAVGASDKAVQCSTIARNKFKNTSLRQLRALNKKLTKQEMKKRSAAQPKGSQEYQAEFSLDSEAEGDQSHVIETVSDQAECSRQGKGAEYHEAASLADEVSKAVGASDKAVQCSTIARNKFKNTSLRQLRALNKKLTKQEMKKRSAAQPKGSQEYQAEFSLHSEAEGDQFHVIETVSLTAEVSEPLVESDEEAEGDQSHLIETVSLTAEFSEPLVENYEEAEGDQSHVIQTVSLTAEVSEPLVELTIVLHSTTARNKFWKLRRLNRKIMK